MAWPDDIKTVECIGFHRRYLPEVMQAIDCEQVKWDTSKMASFAGSNRAEFIWNGQTFALEEFFETVTSIALIPSKKYRNRHAD